MLFGPAYGTGITIYSAPPSAWAGEVNPALLKHEALDQDPVLGVKRRVPPPAAAAGSQATDGQGRRFRDLLPDLARAYGIQFLADAYWNSPPGTADLSLLPQPVALYEVLDRFASASHRWERRGDLVRLRSRTWSQQRPREIPLRLVRRWMAFFEERGGLPLEEYVAMAQSLPEPRLESLREVARDVGLPASIAGFRGGRHILLLYGALTPAQRQALRHGAELPVIQMTPEQQALFRDAVNADTFFLDSLRDPKPVAAGSWSMSVRPSAVMREIPGKGIRSQRELAVVLRLRCGDQEGPSVSLDVATEK